MPAVESKRRFFQASMKGRHHDSVAAPAQQLVGLDLVAVLGVDTKVGVRLFHPPQQALGLLGSDNGHGHAGKLKRFLKLRLA